MKLPLKRVTGIGGYEIKAIYTTKDEAMKHAKKIERELKMDGVVTIDKSIFQRNDGKQVTGYIVRWRKRDML